MADADAIRMSQARTMASKLSADNIDDLGRALLLLANEVAVLADRQKVLEAVLAERGIDVSDAVRDYQPSGKVAEDIASGHARLAKLIVDALCPPIG
ncbi:MAG: hypothetical protein IBJ12_01450 [Sphingomonadaceae bacterium]|nr:hypothetical protein [Sphingomonadaceae bacterium]